MQVQINTDHNIQHDEALEAWVTGVVESALAHSSNHITRVEVHLSDENGGKSGQHDKRCMMEARLERRSPVAVTDHAATLDKAVNDAAGKLARMIASAVGRAAEFKASPD
ncbi:MAG: HPF/RaiA family ribosome-associated protein [Gammaproteobacteria bacterium]|nr:HPF/RaiA family ribosome-associated protein [Gammaproteobacteria bacterium]